MLLPARNISAAETVVMIIFSGWLGFDYPSGGFFQSYVVLMQTLLLSHYPLNTRD